MNRSSDPRPVVVIETWCLKPECESDALRLMQEMDDLLGPAAHEHPGWCGHARFYQRSERPADVLMVYPWRSEQLHRDLISQEESKLASFVRAYCRAPRRIEYFSELPVDVEASV